MGREGPPRKWGRPSEKVIKYVGKGLYRRSLSMWGGAL